MITVTKRYKIHWNGARPFLVKIYSDGKVSVHVQKQRFSKSYSREPFQIWNPIRIFVGKSPLNNMTAYSGGHGKEFDGNSILIHLHDRTYVHFSRTVKMFDALDEIVSYTSPVGNNDCPYPFAVDVRGRYYLLIEGIVADKIPVQDRNDPYEWYYKHSTIFDGNDDSSPHLHIDDEPEPSTFLFGSYLQSFFSKATKIWITYKVNRDVKVEIMKEELMQKHKEFGESHGFMVLISPILLEYNVF